MAPTLPPSETTPLVVSSPGSKTSLSTQKVPQSPGGTVTIEPASKLDHGLFPPIRRVFLCSFLLSMSYSFTQTSLIYAFRIMTCDEWYKTHGPYGGGGDRCSLPAIEARTAQQVALMSTVTSTCTLINLFVTGFWMKKFGVKAAMAQQTAWSALRNLTQIYAQGFVGGGNGMKIIQTTQLINILGGGGGYQLAANAFVAGLAAPTERTSMFGVLSGVTMGGSSMGYIFGGLVFSYIGPLAPFEVTFCLLVSVTIFASIFLPYIPPDHDDHPSSSTGVEKKKKSFLQPLKVFLPRKKDVGDRKKWDFNLTLLGLGAFFSVLATGYVPMALQLVGTNVFGFKPAESGFMLSLTLMVRAGFLSLLFPRIISSGRKLLSSKQTFPAGSTGTSNGDTNAQAVTSTNGHTPTTPSSNNTDSTAIEDRPDSPHQAPEPNVVQAPQPETPRAPTDLAHGSLFDLYFLRYSIFLDGLLTAGVSLSTRSWHLYLAASVLPFASGTGPACRGVVLDMVEGPYRADALAGIALIEKLAQVSTIGLFGVVFSALSEVGKPTLVFLANASIAMVGFLWLCFVRMPKTGQIALA